MKRNLLYGVLAVAGLSLLACQNMEQDLSEAVNVPDTRTVFYAEIEQSEDTKVYADEDLMILWHADDRISIFNRYTYNLEYRFEGETGANAGAFWAVPNDDMIVGNALDAIYAVYPYDEQTSISNQGMLSVMLPEKQEYAENSFGRGANYMVSSTYNNRLLFRNVCGYLSVKLYGEGVSVSRITLRGNAGEKLSGLGSIEAPVGGIPVLTMSEDAGEEVSLVCPQPVKLGATSDAYTEFWFAIPPTEFEQGLTVTVYDDGFGSFEKSTSTPISVTRSNLSRLSPVEAEIVTPEQPNNEIWYTTTDGEVVAVNYPAAFNVNLVSNTYENGLGILRFDGDLVSTGDPYGGSSRQAPFYHADNLKSISLPESVDVLGCMTFCYCAALDHVILPSHLTTLGYNVFYGCRSLTSLYIPETDDIYSVFGDCPSIASFEGPYASEDGRFLVKENKLYLVAPYQLTSCVVPDSIESINDAAFRGCIELVEVTLPSGLTEIPGFLFDGCWNLQHVTIPEGIKTVGSYAFAYCSLLRNIYLPDSVETIDFYAFTGCSSLTSFTIPASIKTISRDNPFAGCSNLAKFKGPYVSEDGRSLIVDGELISIAPAGLTSYTVPSGVTVLGARLFENDSQLETIIIPEGVTKSYYGAFSGCSSLRSLTMPSTWTEFDGDQFFGCSSLESLTVLSPVPPTRFLNSASSFLKDYYGTIGCTIYVPAESVDAYKTAEVWSDYADQIQAIPGPAPAANEIWYTSVDGEVVQPNYTDSFNTTIVSNTYEDGLGIIRFEEALTEIGDGAFWGCPFVTLQLPSSLQVIRDQAFGSCRYLETLDIPKSVTEIGSYNCFAYCKSLASFTGKFATEDHKALIVDGTMVGFAQSGLTEYTVDDSVVILGSVFAGCSELTSISLPSTIEEIRNEAFESCTGLTELTLPNSLVSLGYNAFRGCSGLQTICIPDGVTFIGSNCFDGCSSLSSFTGKYASEEGRCLIEDTRMIGVALSGVRSLSIPEGVTETCTIKGYDELENIVFPSTITTLGQVSYCNGLQSIVMHMTTPPSSFIRSQWFSNLPWLFLYTNDCPVYVPAISVSAYKTADVWCDYADRIHSLGDAQVAVDLGLPSGVKWATCNLGATSPEGYGSYYAWGEVEQKEFYNWSTYKWCNGTETSFTKYNTDSSYGTVDDKTVLDPDDDVAHIQLGGSWRMPTNEEWLEVLEKCKWTWVTDYNGTGINGELITGPNGNSIFLPANGFRYNDDLCGVGDAFECWTSSYRMGFPYCAWYGIFEADGMGGSFGERFVGRAIRPVTE